MHLGLIDGPFVPHTIIAQWSPVPIPKFQMAPKLKTLMFFNFPFRRVFLYIVKKALLASSWLSVSLSVGMYQRSSHSKIFCEI